LPAANFFLPGQILVFEHVVSPDVRSMNILSKREAHPPSAAPVVPGAVARSLEHARTLYRNIAEELFELCYAIQVTGKLPDPVLLTETLLEYWQARALAEALTLQASGAWEEEMLAGTPAR
jgi:hypothetical protein